MAIRTIYERADRRFFPACIAGTGAIVVSIPGKGGGVAGDGEGLGMGWLGAGELGEGGAWEGEEGWGGAGVAIEDMPSGHIGVGGPRVG